MFIKTANGWRPLWRLDPPKPMEDVSVIRDPEIRQRWLDESTATLAELRRRADDRLSL